MIKKHIGIIIFLLILLLTPNFVWANAGVEKMIFISVDEIDFKNILQEDLRTFSVGLVNIKTRKPYNDENLFYTLNVGRKISEKELVKENLHLDYLGDVMEKSNPSFLSCREGSIKKLIEREDGLARGETIESIEAENLLTKINKIFKTSDFIALELNKEFSEDDLKILINELENRVESIMIMPRNASSNGKVRLNNYLVPFIYKEADERGGVLTSNSTNRLGIIAIEDISAEIKSKLGYKSEGIGERIRVLPKENPYGVVEKIYKVILNQLLVASISHGIMYLSIGALFLGSIFKRAGNWGVALFKFALINIGTSLVLGSVLSQERLLSFLFISFLFNIGVYYLIKKKDKYWNCLLLGTYVLIVYGTIIKPNIIYNSYMGFNNLVYGARFYGLNNGIAGVLLASSIINIDNVNESLKNECLKKFIIILIGMVNIITLSTKYGVNTGAFITSIILFAAIMFTYIFSVRWNKKSLLYLVIFICIIFGLNIYLDYKTTGRGHALQFVERIIKNGFGEIIYMLGFKLKELLRLTIMPPFSLVLLSQFYIVKNYFISNKKNNLIAWTSLVGFLINDTGNILLIYMISYMILEIIRERNLTYMETIA